MKALKIELGGVFLDVTVRWSLVDSLWCDDSAFCLSVPRPLAGFAFCSAAYWSLALLFFFLLLVLLLPSTISVLPFVLGVSISMPGEKCFLGLGGQSGPGP
jgi:hypothetical protein